MLISAPICPLLPGSVLSRRWPNSYRETERTNIFASLGPTSSHPHFLPPSPPHTLTTHTSSLLTPSPPHTHTSSHPHLLTTHTSSHPHLLTHSPPHYPHLLTPSPPHHPHSLTTLTSSPPTLSHLPLKIFLSTVMPHSLTSSHPLLLTTHTSSHPQLLTPSPPHHPHPLTFHSRSSSAQSSLTASLEREPFL